MNFRGVANNDAGLTNKIIGQRAAGNARDRLADPARLIRRKLANAKL